MGAVISIDAQGSRRVLVLVDGIRYAQGKGREVLLAINTFARAGETDAMTLRAECTSAADALQGEVAATLRRYVIEKHKPEQVPAPVEATSSRSTSTSWSSSGTGVPVSVMS